MLEKSQPYCYLRWIIVTLRDYDAERLAAFTNEINAKYDELKARNLALDLLRDRKSVV